MHWCPLLAGKTFYLGPEFSLFGYISESATYLPHTCGLCVIQEGTPCSNRKHCQMSTVWVVTLNGILAQLRSVLCSDHWLHSPVLQGSYAGFYSTTLFLIFGFPIPNFFSCTNTSRLMSSKYNFFYGIWLSFMAYI